MASLIVRGGGVAAMLAGSLIVVQDLGRDGRRISGGMTGSVNHTTQVSCWCAVSSGFISTSITLVAGFGQFATLVALFGVVTLFVGALVTVTVMPALPSNSPLIETPRWL